MTVAMTQETISPEIAAKYLAVSATNRPIVPGRVNSFSQDIAAGQWAVNGESIKFDWEGHLIDGQHRLSAVVDAGVPIETLVVRGLETKAIETIDTGSKRTFGNVLSFEGEHNAAALAAVVRFHWMCATYGQPKTNAASYPTVRQLLAHLKDNPGLRQSASLGVQASHSSLKVQASMAGGLHYQMTQLDPELGKAFWKNLLENSATKGDGIYALRESLIRDLGRPHRMDTNWKSALVIKAWNFWLAGRTGIDYIMWRGAGPTAEPYPTIHEPKV